MPETGLSLLASRRAKDLAQDDGQREALTGPQQGCEVLGERCFGSRTRTLHEAGDSRCRSARAAEWTHHHGRREVAGLRAGR